MGPPTVLVVATLLLLAGPRERASPSGPRAVEPFRRIQAAEAAPSPAARDWSEITGFVGGFIREAQIPAAAVVVAAPDGIRYSRGFGMSRGRPVTEINRFFIGSGTKTLTALGVLRAAQAGLLQLDDPVVDHLPEFAFDDVAASSMITIRQLLAHTSGIGTRSAFDRRAQEEGVFRHLELDGSPGSQADYSSLNYVILGQVIEVAAGTSYASFMADEVFGPLGMVRTSARQPEPEDIVQGHTYFFGWPFARAEPPYPRLMIPAGYVTTTAADMGRYLAMLLRRGRVGESVFLDERLVAEMFTTWDGSETGHGLGWGIVRRHGLRGYYHAGMTPGFYSHLLVLPDAGYAVAVLVARNAGPFWDAPSELADGIVRRLTGLPTVEYSRRELWLRLGFLLLLVHMLVSAVRTGRRWWRRGRPLRLSRELRVSGRLALDLALIAGGVVLVLYGLAEITLGALLEFYPDLGLLVLMGVAIGVPESFVKAALRSAPTLDGAP